MERIWQRGKDSEEFMVLSSVGEDEIFVCNSCNYTANAEKAQSEPPQVKVEQEGKIEKVHTPNVKTIAEVCEFLNVDTNQTAKSLLYKNENGEIFCFVLAGDDTLNETKAKNATSSIELIALKENEIAKIGLVNGFIGPIGLTENIYLIADNRLKNCNSIVVGANELDYHLKYVSIMKDTNAKFFDIRNAKEGETCPVCHKGKLKKYMGIEVGHIFKLGLKYSKAMNVVHLDKNGKQQYIYMGCV